MGISVTIAGGAGISVNVSTKQLVTSPELQAVWDTSNNTKKNTFVDANDTEIATFLDYSPDAYAAVAAYPNALATGEKALLLAMVQSQIDSGNWIRLDSLAFFNLTDSTNGLWDIKRGISMTAVNGLTHSAGIGKIFNGSTQYINSNYNPSTDAVNLTQNNALIGVFVKTFTNDSSVVTLTGVLASTNLQLLNIDGTNVRMRINDNSNDNKTTRFGTNKLNIMTRLSSTTTKWFQDGIIVETNTANSLTTPNDNIFIGARNNSGADNFMAGTLSSFIAGATIGFNQSNYSDKLATLNLGLAAL